MSAFTASPTFAWESTTISNHTSPTISPDAIGILGAMGFPATATIAWASLFLNSFVILLILQQQKEKRQQQEQSSKSGNSASSTPLSDRKTSLGSQPPERKVSQPALQQQKSRQSQLQQQAQQQPQRKVSQPSPQRSRKISLQSLHQDRKVSQPHPAAHRPKAPPQLTQGQIHLLFLAVSDLTVAASFVGGAAFDWTLPHDSIIDAAAYPASFNTIYAVWFYSLVLTVGSNRWLTLYITYKRAAAVRSISGAQRAIASKPRENLKEALIFGVGLGLLQTGARWGAYWVLAGWGYTRAFSLIILVYLIIIVLIMGCLAAFILYRVRRDTLLSNPAIDDFQQLVAAVALVYCVCQIPFLTDYFYLLTHPKAGRISCMRILTNVFIVLNSCLNLFIYLICSRSFRTAFGGFGKRLRRRVKGKGGKRGGELAEEGNGKEGTKE